MKILKKIAIFLIIISIIVTLGCIKKDQNNNENANMVENYPYENNTLVDKINEFNTKSIDGTQVTENILEEHSLTMIHVWGTFCSPCISEMPTLEILYHELENEGIGMIAIVIDGKTNEALQIVDETGTSFIHTIPDNNLVSYLDEVYGVPYTFFVDSKGNVVGNDILGARDLESYKAAAIEALSLVKDKE